MRRYRSVLVIAVVASAVLANGAFGQWLNYPDPATPRTRDGKPDLFAKAPRDASGKPDLSGVWHAAPEEPGVIDRLVGDLSPFVVPGDNPRAFSRYWYNVLADFKPSDAPLRPEIAELLKNRGSGGGDSRRCLPQSLPGADILNYAPFKIIQARGVTVILYEVDNTHRQIYTDGRGLPVDPQPSWLGYSVGRWDGETFVVDTAGFNDTRALDRFGHPRTEALRIQERFHRRDFGHMDLELTITDPSVFTRPITFTVTQLLVPDSDVLEYICNENNKAQPQ